MHLNINIIRRSLIRAVAPIAMTIAATSVCANPASAAVYNVYGTAGYGLNVRAEPNLSATLLTILGDGTAVDVVCQTRGDNVVASTMWDKIDQPVAGYVADYYISTPVVNNPSPGLPACEASPPNPVPTPIEPPPTQSEPNTTGGQQIVLYAPADQSASICGTNQNGQHVCHSFNTPGYGSTKIPNWWWHGEVVIYNYADTGAKTHYLGSTTCQVPLAQMDSQWTACNGVPARGNETKAEKHSWGMRIWLRHTLAESVWQSVKASGGFAVLDHLPIPKPLSWIVGVALKDPACIGRFVNDLGSRDVGYGVVMDINWWAPFWACGSMKVWAQ